MLTDTREMGTAVALEQFVVAILAGGLEEMCQDSSTIESVVCCGS
jgi:hypothetical protein